jgi:hypothetical protein
MIRPAITIFLLLFFIGCAPSLWTKEDTYRQIVVGAVIGVDWMQTRSIYNDPEFEELNPAITEGNVNLYFPLAFIAHTAIAAMLPEKQREWWQIGWIGAELITVTRNRMMGIGMRNQ